MNLKQLEAFAGVAETKSFSLTAKQLFLTQPTVSAHIASLEKELNTCLFIRSTKGVALSDDGKELYAYAEQMLELEKRIRERFGKNGRFAGGVLRIAASTIPSQYLLPDIMVRFREAFPGEKLKVFETDSAGVAEMIASHRADVGFAGTRIEKGGCTYLPIYQDELVVITTVSEKYKDKGIDDAAGWLREEPVILREEGSGTRQEAQKLLLQMGIDMAELNVAAIMENQETIKRSVENGMGISILSDLAVRDAVQAGKLFSFPLGRTGGKRDIYLVSDEGYPSLPGADKFIRTVKEIYHTDTERITLRSEDKDCCRMNDQRF